MEKLNGVMISFKNFTFQDKGTSDLYRNLKKIFLQF